MYFSLPEYIPPHPLGGTRVRKQWSALYYFIACCDTGHIESKTHKFVYGVIVIVIINIYKCHCYPDSCKHFRLNNVTDYGEYIMVVCSGRDEKRVSDVEITEQGK